MNFNEVRKIAKERGVKLYKMKMTELIREIQRSEKNLDCYGTVRVDSCYEDSCLWRENCVSLNLKNTSV